MERFPCAPETFYTYRREAIGDGARHADKTVAGPRPCRMCGREFDRPFRIGNAMTPGAPPGEAYADGASRAYCSMACFMQGDGELEQAPVDRDASGWWALARRNWFGLKVLYDDRKRGA